MTAVRWLMRSPAPPAIGGSQAQPAIAARRMPRAARDDGARRVHARPPGSSVAEGRSYAGGAWPVLVAAVLLALAARPAAAQVPSPLRVVTYRTVPDTVAVGQQFELQVTLRAGPDATVLIPDTLIAADGARSSGPGTWTPVPAPEDSVDIRAVYPLIALQQGLVPLPSIEVAVRPRESSISERLGPLSSASPDDLVRQGFTIHEIPIGAVQIAEYAPLAESDSALVPRPAADVVGGQWSVWIIVGAVTAILLVLGAVIAWFTGLWSRLAPSLFGPRPLSPKQEALRELDRIRALGWHRNGRMDDFYAASTDALRRYAGRLDPEWVPALTSRELLAQLEQRWGESRLEVLAEVIETAERVKFGRYRPDGDQAEADWSAIRDWIVKGPEK
mgnify:CR=1 FL=1